LRGSGSLAAFSSLAGLVVGYFWPEHKLVITLDCLNYWLRYLFVIVSVEVTDTSYSNKLYFAHSLGTSATSDCFWSTE
jgi:hypothetical protein